VNVISVPSLTIVSDQLYVPSLIKHVTEAPVGTVVLIFNVADAVVTVEYTWNPSYPYCVPGKHGLVNNLTLPSVALKLKSPAAGAR
jgi:hypothetical protein